MTRKLAFLSLLVVGLLAVFAAPTLAHDSRDKPSHRHCTTVYFDRHGNQVSAKKARYSERRCTTRPGWAKGHDEGRRAYRGDYDGHRDRRGHRDHRDRDHRDRDHRDRDRDHRGNVAGYPKGCPPIAPNRDGSIIRDLRGCPSYR